MRSYWYFEGEIPGRYVFEALPMLLILIARGMGALDGAETRLRRAGRPLGAAILLTSGILFSLTAGFPAQFSRFGPDYYDVEDTLPRLMKEFRIHNALVFIGGRGYYATGFMRNRLDLQGDVVFARDLGGPADRRLMAQYPGRRYYLLPVPQELEGRGALRDPGQRGPSFCAPIVCAGRPEGSPFGRTPPALRSARTAM